MKFIDSVIDTPFRNNDVDSARQSYVSTIYNTNSEIRTYTHGCIAISGESLFKYKFQR